MRGYKFKAMLEFLPTPQFFQRLLRVSVNLWPVVVEPELRMNAEWFSKAKEKRCNAYSIVNTEISNIRSSEAMC